MTCPKYEESEMESIGYGDLMCSNDSCGHVEYSESEEDFLKRIFGEKNENRTVEL